MSKLQDFNVEFDRHSLTYKPGETVRGTVVFTLTEPKNVREVRWRARGSANVWWAIYGGSERGSYRNKEIYFDIIDQVLVGETEDEQVTLEAGQHSYNFSFQLPKDIPSSFRHEYMWVQYNVKAILDRPWRFDHEVQSGFLVVAPYDASFKEEFDAGIDDEFEHNFLSYCCFDAGTIDIKVRSKTRGFSPGETIKLKINYDRSSTQVNIKKIKLKLVKAMKFYSSSGKIKCECDVLGKVYDSTRFKERGKSVMKIVVPEIYPSNLQNCSIIDVNYQLELCIKVSGMHSNITRFYNVLLWDTE